MSKKRFHPANPHSRACAPSLMSGALTDAFECALNDREEFGAECGFGALEVIAALAIARVQLLEALISEVVGGERAREANVIQFPDRTPAA